MKKLLNLAVIIVFLAIGFWQTNKGEGELSLIEMCKSVTETFSSGYEYLLRGLSLSKRDKLSEIVGTYWYNWKSEGRDTANCILDFENIMPFEWDTLMYFRYELDSPGNGKELEEYVNTRYPEAKRYYSVTRLHFLRGGKIVHDVNLYMMSDDAKGVYFCTRKNFIKRGRKDAIFHLIKDDKFYPLRVISEEYVEPFNF
ncbi:MAG: hypothetical protein E7092_09705 [Bacteroidales bacterium]|nr:hypothetical protein [Bacteroidales bacterium]